jgi:hypothetical protein
MEVSCACPVHALAAKIAALAAAIAILFMMLRPPLITKIQPQLTVQLVQQQKQRHFIPVQDVPNKHNAQNRDHFRVMSIGCCGELTGLKIGNADRDRWVTDGQNSQRQGHHESDIYGEARRTRGADIR